MGSTPTAPIMLSILISIGVVYITYPHDEYGWDIDDERNWSFSIITLENIINSTSDNWTREAILYLKPSSYNYAERIFPQLIGTEKYEQTIRSIHFLNRI